MNKETEAELIVSEKIKYQDHQTDDKALSTSPWSIPSAHDKDSKHSPTTSIILSFIVFSQEALYKSNNTGKSIGVDLESLSSHSWNIIQRAFTII